MTRNLPVMLLVGALCAAAGCAKKTSVDSSGSLLSDAAEAEEQEREKGLQNEDPTREGGTGPNTPTPR